MAQFGGFDDNWGLQAIVRGSSTTSFSPGGGGGCYNGDLDYFQINNDENVGFIFNDDNIFQNRNSVMHTTDDDFQQIYQPFYPVVWDSSSSSPPHQNMMIPSSNDIKLQESDDPKHLINSLPDQSTATNNAQTTTTTPKYKRRKNQQKRMVIQSAAGEGVPWDVWAWRKYGQKPIKGSPYPRSYYRCSSSKSCIAKKQVEQSCIEPGINIITYTAEHNHSQPIRKNALAGTTRQKFPTTQITTPAAENTICKCLRAAGSTTSASASSSSCDQKIQIAAASNIILNNELDGCSFVTTVKQEEKRIDDDKEMMTSSDIKMEDEFFAGLDDLDDFLVGGGGQQQKMFSMNFYTY